MIVRKLVERAVYYKNIQSLKNASRGKNVIKWNGKKNLISPDP